MRGLYTERVASGKIPFGQMVSGILHSDSQDYVVEQFCDDGEGEVNRYNVYKITVGGKCYVLKKSDDVEIGVYEHFLKGQGLPAPDYFGSAQWDGKRWILIEYVPGTDLRDYTPDMAIACAESISRIANRYWQQDEAEFARGRQDGRFERYWKRINKRAECLKEEPTLKTAYDCFLERQRTCPRTLSNGDFLQFNAIFRDGRVTLVDWAFGGIMPYSLDIARMIAHGTLDRRTFPFYMTRAHKEQFVGRTYELLERKPDYDRYLADIRLAVLNEYIEFIEGSLLDKSQARDEVFDYYYAGARKLAEQIMREDSA